MRHEIGQKDLAQLLLNLARLRKRQHMSQRKLAQTMGTSQSAICELEHGESIDPKLSTLQRLAYALGYKISLELVPLDSHHVQERAMPELVDLTEGLGLYQDDEPMDKIIEVFAAREKGKTGKPT